VLCAQWKVHKEDQGHIGRLETITREQIEKQNAFKIAGNLEALGWAAEKLKDDAIRTQNRVTGRKAEELIGFDLYTRELAQMKQDYESHRQQVIMCLPGEIDSQIRHKASLPLKNNDWEDLVSFLQAHHAFLNDTQAALSMPQDVARILSGSKALESTTHEN
jgi:hypothetical protein